MFKKRKRERYKGGIKLPKQKPMEVRQHHSRMVSDMYQIELPKFKKVKKKKK